MFHYVPVCNAFCHHFISYLCTSAITLKGKGITNFVILEAKDHIGGRSYTTMENFDGEWVPVDHGSMWIHGGAVNPIHKIAKMAKIHTTNSSFHEKIFKAHGRGSISSSQLKSIRNKWYEQGFLPYQERLQDSTDVDQPLLTALNQFLSTLPNGEEKEVLKYIIKSDIDLDYTGSIKELSLWWWDMDQNLDGDDEDDFLLPDGFGPLVEVYAAPVRNKVQLNKIVTQIQYPKNNLVKVICGSQTYSGQKVILTVPLGVLKSNSISFEPSLPSDHQRSIHRIGMGSINKIFMFWSKKDVFWDRDTEQFGDVVERKFDFKFFNFRAYNGDRPFLIGWLKGPEPEHIEKLHAKKDYSRYCEEMRDIAMIPLRNMFGEDIPLPQKVIATAWNEDVFTKGSYSFNRVGMGENDRKILAKPFGNDRIFIAGEATSHEHFQTVHGAYWSGINAANLLANSITKQQYNHVQQMPNSPAASAFIAPADTSNCMSFFKKLLKQLKEILNL